MRHNANRYNVRRHCFTGHNVIRYNVKVPWKFVLYPYRHNVTSYIVAVPRKSILYLYINIMLLDIMYQYLGNLEIISI